MVVDSGLALTLDIVAADGRLKGGLICPGLNTMLQAMVASADLLVLPEQPDMQRGPTFASIQAIQNGALTMAVSLMKSTSVMTAILLLSCAEGFRTAGRSSDDTGAPTAGSGLPGAGSGFADRGGKQTMTLKWILASLAAANIGYFFYQELVVGPAPAASVQADIDQSRSGAHLAAG